MSYELVSPSLSPSHLLTLHPLSLSFSLFPLTFNLPQIGISTQFHRYIYRFTRYNLFGMVKPKSIPRNSHPKKYKTARQFYIKNKQFSMIDLDLQNPEHVEGLKIQTIGCVYFFPGSSTNSHNRLQTSACNFIVFLWIKFHGKRSMEFEMLGAGLNMDCSFR
jgi:hypothetical protein